MRSPSSQIKKNKNIEKIFAEAIQSRLAGSRASTYSTQEKSHRREEIRNYIIISDIAGVVEPEQKWKNLQSIGMVESARTVDEKTS